VVTESTDSREERVAVREAEQTAAAKEVGVTNLTFLHWPDGRVENHHWRYDARSPA